MRLADSADIPAEDCDTPYRCRDLFAETAVDSTPPEDGTRSCGGYPLLLKAGGYHLRAHVGLNIPPHPFSLGGFVVGEEFRPLVGSYLGTTVALRPLPDVSSMRHSHMAFLSHLAPLKWDSSGWGRSVVSVMFSQSMWSYTSPAVG